MKTQLVMQTSDVSLDGDEGQPQEMSNLWIIWMLTEPLSHVCRHTVTL